MATCPKSIPASSQRRMSAMTRSCILSLIACATFRSSNAAEIAKGDWMFLAASRQRSNASKPRSEEHTSELQSLMRISYAVFCLKKKKKQHIIYILHKPPDQE